MGYAKVGDNGHLPLTGQEAISTHAQSHTCSCCMTRVLAIDLGGTNPLAYLFTGDVSDMQSLTQEAAPTDLASFTTRVMSLLRKAGDVGAIGLAVPGLVSDSTCRWIPNLPYLDSIDVQAIFPGLRI